MTREQIEQNLVRMEQMKQRQGGQQPAQQAAPQAGTPGQQRPAGQGAPPAGGGGQRDPKVVAEQLKTSLEGIKLSADFLLKSSFVK
jgi:hypothetical protein